MNKQITFALLSAALMFSGCKTMETAIKKMEGVNKSVLQADAKFREKAGLPAYTPEKNAAMPEN